MSPAGAELAKSATAAAGGRSAPAAVRASGSGSSNGAPSGTPSAGGLDRAPRATAPPPVTRPKVSLRFLVPSVAVALLFSAVLGAALISEHNSRTILLREIETRLLLEARSLANTGAGALLGDVPELTLHPIVREMLAERPELALAAVIDRDGVIQGHADARALGTRWIPPARLEPAPASITLKDGETLERNGELLLATAPIVPPSGGKWGSAVVAMRRAHLDSAIADSRRQQSWLLLAVLIAGTAITFVMMTLMLRPIGVLNHGLERIGRGDLDTPLKTGDHTELGMLAHAVNRMARQLKTAQREIVEKERLAREVELARGIQQLLLPHGRVEAGRFTLEGAHRAAAEVGGDYYDILPLPEGRIGVTIADVSGKGLAGCLVMAMLSALLRALRTTHESPSRLLVALEDNLNQTLPRGSFVTMFYGVLDPHTGEMTFSSAGHTPVLVYHAASQRVEWRYGRAIPIGAVRGGALARMLRDESLLLEPGDLLVHFTDGYHEAMRNGDGEQFGLERMADVVRRTAAEGPSQVIAALGDAVKSWAGSAPPLDDETLLVVGYTGAPPAAAPAATDDAVPQATVAATDDASTTTPVDLLPALRRALGEGRHLHLPVDLEELVGIRAWIESCPELRGLEPRSSRLLESALYELCANVIEHGHRDHGPRGFDLWWVPAPSAMLRPASDDAAERAAAASRQLCEGSFLLRDHGAPFVPPERPLLDFNDPRVRRRGRGIGLDMVRRIMKSIDYQPGTPEGNLTRMMFDPARAGLSEGEDT